MSLYGLVICGGQSTRMGADKSTLIYYQKPQHDHVADLLAPFCEKVVVCCNEGQFSILQSAYEKLPDLPAFANSGPAAALLTAFETFPGKDFLVVGCDYPYLTAAELSNFLNFVEQDLTAAAFYNHQGWHEPLLAWYSRFAAPSLTAMFTNGSCSLQRFLQEQQAGKYQPLSKKTMKSVDTPEDFHAVMQELASQNKQ
nr:molybdenum cofactor guanylyltransferase [uncultured Dyadobacter sp.]